jgi:hypothetical protein
VLVAVQEGSPNHERDGPDTAEHDQLDPAPFDHDRDVPDDRRRNQRTSDVNRTSDDTHHDRDRMCRRTL